MEDQELYEEVGQRIRSLRREHDWTQAQLAEQMDCTIDQSMVAKIEKGKRRMTVGDLVRFAGVFDVSIESLCADDGSRRSRYLLVSEVELLRAWGRELYHAFGEMPYLVGSALRTKDWRDVDVRIMLDGDKYDMLIRYINPRILNLSLSLWGQKATGLPIDCQVQQVWSANEDYGDQPRDPLALPVEALDKWKPES